MTAAAQAESGRPAKPRPSWAIPLGMVAFVAITWVSVSKEFGINLDLGELAENIGRGARILWREDDNPADRGLMNPNWVFVSETAGPMIETFAMAVLASVMGCGLALPVSFLVSRVTSPNRAVLTVGRGILSVVRAIPDILYALLFVAAVGVGALPGILALLFFNIGVTVKLLSETVDGVDPGPIEAGRASGATGMQTTRWTVVPQILPNYVAYSLYVFELNIRASTVLGIVGAGGIGRMLYREYGFFHWSNVSVIIVELFVMVFFIELVSIYLRRRLV
ncbi:MAG TPA: phosphonate ABC transporter, permease protein PhnE [Candidatus Deferrimicrobiaceae bacterium]|nr:phosphonate ABC transporter, permease protein PhnE [Candidatus Deferrimicrobiaceae bacterium]